MPKTLQAGVSINPTGGDPITSNISVTVSDTGDSTITITGSDGTNINLTSDPSHSVSDS